MKRRRNLKETLSPYLYLAPFLIGVIVFTLYPMINVFIMSFKENYKYLTGAFSGFGLDNYTTVLRLISSRQSLIPSNMY